MKDLAAFIHVAKTGGQSIETMLANSYGCRYSTAPEWKRKKGQETDQSGFVVPKFGAEDLDSLLRLCPWTKCVGGHPVTLWSGFESVTPTRYFSMIREPLARGASHFQYNLQDITVAPRQWEAWVDWPVHHNHQTKMFSPTGKADDAIARIRAQDVFVGLTESFDESLVLLEKLILPGLNPSYRRTNTASDNTQAREVLADPGKVGTMREMYAEDLLLHEFIQREHYPMFRKMYGKTLEADVDTFRKNRQSGFNKWKYWQSRLNYHLLLRPSALLFA